jgi:hypothetical protein
MKRVAGYLESSFPAFHLFEVNHDWQLKPAMSNSYKYCNMRYVTLRAITCGNVKPLSLPSARLGSIFSTNPCTTTYNNNYALYC